jgi:hypothetical protein
MLVLPEAIRLVELPYERGRESLSGDVAEGEPEAVGGAVDEPEIAGEHTRRNGDGVDFELRSQAYAITRSRSWPRGTLKLEN